MINSRLMSFINRQGHTINQFDFREPVDEWILSGDRELSFDPSSSFVGTVTYTQELQSLEIILNGKNYNFCNVPQRIFDQFGDAGSKGAFFNRSLKGNYQC